MLGFSTESLHSLHEFLIEFINVVSCQENNIIGPFPQGRNQYRNNTDPVKESSRNDPSAAIWVISLLVEKNEPNIDRNVFRPPQSADITVL